MPDPWTQSMRQGDFENAWKVSDVLLHQRAGIPCHHLPRHMQYVWNGKPLHGKRVLIRCYHGLGDTIQFIRYALLMKAIAAEVIVWAQPPLIPLLQTMQGIDRFLPLHDGTPDVDYDIDVEVMELPYIFRTILHTIPSHVPYLHVDPATRFDDGAYSVGLVWQAGTWDERRSIPFLLLEPLNRIPNTRLHILQQNPEMSGWHEGFGIRSTTNDILTLARLIRALDLVVSVDTMPPHLAGALGIPVWTLLHTDPDWRWMLDRDDSPWYPSMRLFRQREAGDWETVINEVCSEITATYRS